jgi:hypothetical protein
MLIDHGTALYFHHTWDDYMKQSRNPFRLIKDHVLLPFASALMEADATARNRLTPALLEEIISVIPESWLGNEAGYSNPDEQRAAYVSYLVNRLKASHIFAEEALHARAQLV